MKVYIVTSEEYEGSTVERVFLDKSLAKEFIGDSSHGPFAVQEFEIQTQVGDERVRPIFEHRICLTTNRAYDVRDNEICRDDFSSMNYYPMSIVSRSAVSKEHAQKLAEDARDEWLKDRESLKG